VPGIPFDESKNAEREVIHGRFAMLGVTGAWAQENLGEGAWFNAGASCTPASCKIDYLGQEAFGNTDNAFWVILLAEIATFGYAEALRTGLVDNAFPELEQGDIYPGGRFDPLNNLGMGNLEELKLKELKHCRLAMFAWLGLIAQAFATNPNGPSDNVGPIANWSAHVADPSGVNIVSVFANR
jgi:light-harvesting complex I chlorophyll a/b binding protein 1